MYSDSSCATLVGVSEVNINTQCFASAYGYSGYVSNVVQYYASDTSSTGLNPYTLSNSYTSPTCQTATTALLSGGVSSPSYTSSCLAIVNTYSATVGYVKYTISSSSVVPTTYAPGSLTYFEYSDSACATSAGKNWYFALSSCVPIVSDGSQLLLYYSKSVCSGGVTTSTGNRYSDSACSTLYSYAGMVTTGAAFVTADAICSSDSYYGTISSPHYLTSGDSGYQKSTCVAWTPTGQVITTLVAVLIYCPCSSCF